MSAMLILLVLVTTALRVCDASVVLGRHTEINYNSNCGTWNDPLSMQGKILEECCPIDATYPGAPWQQLSLRYIQGTQTSHFSGNTDSSCTQYTVLSEKVLDDGTGKIGIEHEISMGLLHVTKREVWNYRDRDVLITFKVKYTKPKYMTSCQPIHNLTVMHAVDPDQDRIPFMTFMTVNDVIYGNGVDDGLFAEAVGPRSCAGFGYGICSARVQADGSEDGVGFTQWQSVTPVSLNDPNGDIRDDTVHYQHNESRPLYCGDEREFQFFVVWGKCHHDARQNFLNAHHKYCSPCHPPPPSVPKPPFPACDGQCPCPATKHNCTCTYMCPTCVPIPPHHRTKSLTEVDAMLTRCGGRKKRQAGPELINIDAKLLSSEDCGHAATERDFYASAPVVNMYYCDPPPTTPTMGTYYHTTPTMGTYYDTTPTMGTYYDTTPTMGTYYDTTPTMGTYYDTTPTMGTYYDTTPTMDTYYHTETTPTMDTYYHTE
eukprot:scpid81729/ scgid3695/ 